MAKAWKLQAVQSKKDKLWYLRLSGGNGEIIMRSAGKPSRRWAEALAARIQAAEIKILPNETDVGVGWHLVPWQSTNDQLFYNTLFFGSSEMMWSEGYPRIDSARRTCERLRTAMVVTLPSLPVPA